jgi:hypothetical protein
MDVKHILLPAVVSSCLCAFAQETPSTSRPTRVYSGRVQMHNMPTEVRAPVDTPEERPRLSDRLQPSLRQSDVMPLDNISPQQRIQPPPVRRDRDREKDRRNRNWILLSTEEEEKKTDDATARDDSGWGWLARDVFEQQEAERSKAEEESKEEDMNLFMLPTERLLQNVSAQGGLLTQPALPSASSSGVLREAPTPDVRSMLVLEEDPSRRDPRSSSVAPDTMARAPEQPALMSGVPGSSPGSVSSGSSRDFDASPKTVLPQTAALLARPKDIETRRSLPGSSMGASSPSASSSLLSPSQASGPLPFSSSWERPAPAPRSMFESFEPPGAVSPPPASSFGRDSFGVSPSAPAQFPVVAPNRPTVDFQGPSWRR